MKTFAVVLIVVGVVVGIFQFERWKLRQCMMGGRSAFYCMMVEK